MNIIFSLHKMTSYLDGVLWIKWNGNPRFKQLLDNSELLGSIVFLQKSFK